MVKLDEKIIEKIISDCEKELEVAKELSFSSVEEVTNTIKISKFGIVYYILSDGVIRYIGKSRGKYFRQRVKSHFFGIGKGTKSKYDYIKNEKNITIKYIEVEPESLRNLVEEFLIDKNKNPKDWNYK